MFSLLTDLVAWGLLQMFITELQAVLKICISITGINVVLTKAAWRREGSDRSDINYWMNWVVD